MSFVWNSKQLESFKIPTSLSVFQGVKVESIVRNYSTDYKPVTCYGASHINVLVSTVISSCDEDMTLEHNSNLGNNSVEGKMIHKENHDEVVIPYKFVGYPRELAEMERFADLISCMICRSYINTSMYLPNCGHYFCSLCIRRSLDAKPECPLCRKPDFSCNLKAFPALDHVASAFAKLELMIKPFLASFSRAPSVEEFLKLKLMMDTVVFNNSHFKKIRESFLKIMEHWNLFVSNNLKLDLKRKKVFQESNIPVRRKKEKFESFKISNIYIPCPFCLVKLSAPCLNFHISSRECMNVSLNLIPTEKRKPLAKLAYKFVKQKDLKQMCSSLGINIAAGTDVLVARHKEFVLRWNASCDMLRPTPLTEILKFSNEIISTSSKSSIIFSPSNSTFPTSSPAPRIEDRTNFVSDDCSTFEALINKLDQQRLSLGLPLHKRIKKLNYN